MEFWGILVFKIVKYRKLNLLRILERVVREVGRKLGEGWYLKIKRS